MNLCSHPDNDISHHLGRWFLIVCYRDLQTDVGVLSHVPWSFIVISWYTKTMKFISKEETLVILCIGIYMIHNLSFKNGYHVHLKTVTVITEFIN